MPPTADVVIIGGGVIGCSIAYWLAKAGIKPLVLERDRLGCAGIAGYRRSGWPSLARRPHPPGILQLGVAQPGIVSKAGIGVD